MATEPTSPATSLTAPVTATRTGPWTLSVDNGRGATLTIGMEDAEGSFSPVELLQAALAGCAALSAEAQLVDKLGADASVSSTAKAAYDRDTNRITHLSNTIAADMASLPAERIEKLIQAAERSVGRLCTVKRSLTHGIEATTTVHNEAVDQPAG